MIEMHLIHVWKKWFSCIWLLMTTFLKILKCIFHFYILDALRLNMGACIFFCKCFSSCIFIWTILINSYKMSFNEYCFGRLYSIFGFAEMHEAIFCICCLPRKHSTNLVNDCSLCLLLRMLTLDSDNSGLISAYPQPWLVNFSTLLKSLHLSVMTYKCLIFNLQWLNLN